MNIVIVGCGEVGADIAAQLSNEEGNAITLVDMSAEKIKELSAKLDVMGVIGNGATHTVLEEAGIEKADLLIAVTESDELNLLCCMIAKKTGSCKVIARVRNPEYRSEREYLKNELGLAMLINPEYASAAEIARIIRFPVATMVEPFAKGRVELIKFRLSKDNVMVGKSVKSLMAELKSDVLICSVERGEDVYIANGDFVFCEHDTVSIISTPKNSAAFFKKTGCRGHSVKNAIIIGAGNISKYLCELLKGENISIKVIERDVKKCEELASKYPGVIVINAEETDKELLIEEGIANADAFIALSDNDEENILLSLFAKRAGAAKLITKINRTDYDDIIKNLDIDTVIYPKTVSSDILVRYVRALKNKQGSNVEIMYSFVRGIVEAAQFVVSGGVSFVGTPLSRLDLKSGVLIAAIIRNDKLIVPRGQDFLLENDKVIVVTKNLPLEDLSDILK